MRRTAGLTVLGLIAAGLTSSATVAVTAAPQHCPQAESLAPKAHWHHHHLARGVRLAEGVAHDRQGKVSMHVVRVQLNRRAVSVRPLMHKLTRRLPLTLLAAGHRRLFTAINTGYFDFLTGAPTGPIVTAGRALVLSTTHQKVVGLDANKRMQSGRVWLAAQLSTPHRNYPVASINELHPPPGLAIYSPRWGARPIYLGDGLSRYINAHGHTAAIGRRRTVHPHGYLLAARGLAAEQALRSLGAHTTVHVHTAVSTTAKHPFRQAYGVGAELVKRAGSPRSGFTCDSANTKTPARTAIGYADHGRTLVLVVVSDHPHTRLHGLDNTQMSKLMTELGVTKAFDFDGSGSAEMLARLHPRKKLAERNYPADGVQRPMPLGLGVFSR